MKQARKQHPISDFGMGISDLFSAFRNPQSEIEKRDPYRAIHQRRVADLAGAIAVRMGLSQDQADRVHMAAIIHDLGKIFIPTDILSKRSQLTETEFDLIKTHPRVGYDILRSMEFPWPVAQIILQHHERMDGSGYPSGLSGEEIFPEARIIAVSDVIEAMTFQRPYRAALGIEKALDEISINKGILYDPIVVYACLRLFTGKGFTFDKESNINQQAVLTFAHCAFRCPQNVQKR